MMNEHEITTTDFMRYVAKRIATGLASASPDEQLNAQNDFTMHSKTLNAIEYIEFADAVRLQVAVIKAAQS